MERVDYNAIYTEKYHSKSVDRLKFWLMPFVMFLFFGLPTTVGGYIGLLSYSTGPVFFILSGFFILSPDGEVRRTKLKHALKSSLKFFLILFAVYVLINILYLRFMEIEWTSEVLRKRTLFDFLVLNIFPFRTGNSIWFIQSYFYANVILLIADKLKLLNKAFIYIPAFLILFGFSVACGELAKVFGFPYFGYPYIPGNAITRALPYMLLGMIIRKYANTILNIRRWLFPVFFAVGLALSLAEYLLLKHFNLLIYGGHMIGFAVMATSVCCFALSKTESKSSFISSHGRNYAKRIYALSQPVYFVFIIATGITAGNLYYYIRAFSSIFVYLICLAIAYGIGVAKFAIADIKKLDNQ